MLNASNIPNPSCLMIPSLYRPAAPGSASLVPRPRIGVELVSSISEVVQRMRLAVVVQPHLGRIYVELSANLTIVRVRAWHSRVEAGDVALHPRELEKCRRRGVTPICHPPAARSGTRAP